MLHPTHKKFDILIKADIPQYISSMNSADTHATQENASLQPVLFNGNSLYFP